MINEVMEYLPKSIKDEIYKFIREQNNVQESIEEIRLRTNKNRTRTNRIKTSNNKTRINRNI